MTSSQTTIHPERTALSVALATWLLPLAVFGYLRDARSLVGAFDTGIYLQVLSNLVHHGDLASSVTGEQNFLAHHFQPVVVLLAPLGVLWERPFALLLAGLAAVVATAGLFARGVGRLVPDGTRDLAAAALFGFCAHASVASRIWYGFSPDVLALPAFAVMALALLEPRRGPAWPVLASALWAGTCKETFWLTDAAVLWAFFDARGERRAAAVGAAACAAVFGALFFWWMPLHTRLPGYYGLGYYRVTEPGRLVLDLLGNLVSERSGETLGWLFLMTLGLPFLSLHRCWLAAAPGLLLILVSRATVVHHPGNHYLLSVLPFLFALSLANLGTVAAWLEGRPLARRLLPYALGAVPLAYSLLAPAGLVDSLALLAKNPQTAAWRRDAERIRDRVPADARLVVDGNLQPLFADHRDTTVLLGFTGNPRRLSDEELRSEMYVVTTEDLKGLKDCDKVEAGGLELETDMAYFQRLCDRVRKDGVLLESFPNSGLHTFHLQRVTAP